MISRLELHKMGEFNAVDDVVLLGTLERPVWFCWLDDWRSC